MAYDETLADQIRARISRRGDVAEKEMFEMTMIGGRVVHRSDR